jgi:hypothetical protein
VEGAFGGGWCLEHREITTSRFNSVDLLSILPACEGPLASGISFAGENGEYQFASYIQ